MKKLISRLAISTMVVLGGGVSATVVAAPQANAAVTLGSPDFAAWCNWAHRANVIYSAGPHNLYNAYSWTCTIPVLGNFNAGGIDANSACRLKYGAGAYAVTTNPGWAHSWQCRR